MFPRKPFKFLTVGKHRFFASAGAVVLVDTCAEEHEKNTKNRLLEKERHEKQEKKLLHKLFAEQVSAKTFLARAENAMQNTPVRLLVLLRLMPLVPFNVFNYYVGATYRFTIWHNCAVACVNNVTTFSGRSRRRCRTSSGVMSSNTSSAVVSSFQSSSQKSCASGLTSFWASATRMSARSAFELEPPIFLLLRVDGVDARRLPGI